jgi:hypothetical protein
MGRARVGGAAGERYGRLVVLGEEPSVHGRRYVLCLCDCGQKKVLRLTHLKGGQQACGCLVEFRKVTHGRSSSPEYRSWTHIIDRCCNPQCVDYPNWGGRGITLHESWCHDFQAFYKHIGPRPTAGHSVDRVNNSKGYEPGNVRWSTKKE